MWRRDGTPPARRRRSRAGIEEEEKLWVGVGEALGGKRERQVAARGVNSCHQFEPWSYEQPRVKSLISMHPPTWPTDCFSSVKKQSTSPAFCSLDDIQPALKHSPYEQSLPTHTKSMEEFWNLAGKATAGHSFARGSIITPQFIMTISSARISSSFSSMHALLCNLLDPGSAARQLLL